MNYENWPENKKMHPGGIDLTGKLIKNVSGRVLDAGFGYGKTISLLLKNNTDVYGIEVSETLLNYCKEKYKNASLIKGDILNMPYKSNYFDTVICECTLSVLEDISKGIKEIYRVLKTGGIFLLSDLHGFENSNIITLDEWKEKITSTGFKIINFEERNDDFKQMVFEILWEQECVDCLPDGCNINNTGYFYMILKK